MCFDLGSEATIEVLSCGEDDELKRRSDRMETLKQGRTSSKFILVLRHVDCTVVMNEPLAQDVGGASIGVAAGNKKDRSTAINCGIL